MDNNRIGVILCSKSKQDYTCSVREMYDSSVSFKARRIFMDLTYDTWYVNTTSKGFMNPDDVIEPYDSWYLEQSRMMTGNVVTEDMVEDWIDGLKKQFPNRDNIILDCHLSNLYFKKLKTIFPKARYIKPMANFTVTAWRYHDASKMYMDGSTLEECLEFITKPHVKLRPEEEEKWFYHYNGDTFFGKAWGLYIKYGVDNGTVYGLSMGRNPIAYGWVTDEKLLKHVYITKKGQYRLPKEISKPLRDAYPYKKRDGLREALIELEKEVNKYKNKTPNNNRE